MSDIPVNPTASYTVAADIIGVAGYQRVKIDIGASGTTGGDVTPLNPLPVTGSISVSQTTAVSGTVSIAATVPVQVAQPVNVSATSAVPVWVTGGVAVAGVAQVSGTVTVAPTVLTVNTLAAGASVNVGALANALVSTTGTSGASGILVWMGPGQTVNVAPGLSVSAVVSGTVNISPTTLTVNTAATVAGASVTIQQGASVVASVSGSITPLVPFTTLPPAVSQTGQVVWLAGGQSSTAFPVIITGTMAVVSGTTAVSGTVSVTPVYATTTAPGPGATGQIIWDAGWNAGKTNVMIVVTSSVAVAGTTYLMTVYQGNAQVTAGVGAWIVPAGKNFRLTGMFLMANNSITTTPVTFRAALLASAATPTWTSAVPMVGIIGGVSPNDATPIAVNVAGYMQDVAAGVTIAAGISATGATGTIGQLAAYGYLMP